LEVWKEHVPPDLYHHEVGNQKIIWLPTGATLRYKPRVITGSKEAAKDRRRGPEYTDVIDDETAIGFDRETFTNTLARIRSSGPCKTYITLTTPKVGPYGRFLKRGGNIIFRGRTRDNHYLLARQPDYETNLRAAMSPEQARRELDGELVALEGRIWKNANYDPDPANKDAAWPNGNRNDIHTGYDKNKPWWILCDLGSALGAYVAVQQMEPFSKARELYAGKPVWVAISDFCPQDDSNANRAFQRFEREYGQPAGVVSGADIGTRAQTDGTTVAYFVAKVFGAGTQIYPCNETIYNKHVQWDSFDSLLLNTSGERRFTIARDFVSFDQQSKRGLREMLDEDQWPPMEKRRLSDVLPKGPDNVVQHVRDAVLMGAAEIMNPPTWRHTTSPVA
jgi:Terminase-like family.